MIHVPRFHQRHQALDKALVAWGVKSPPGEPDVDLKDKIKSAGLAGALAYGGTELAFWVISVPLAVVGYHQTTGEWLDLTTLEGKEEASTVLTRGGQGGLEYGRSNWPVR